MSRRWFVAVASSLFSLPLAVMAQQVAKIRRIGWLWNQTPFTRFRQHTMYLRALGWTEGQNLVIEQRYASGNADLLLALAEELVQLKVEIIVAEGTIAALAAKKATSAIPIVVARSGDPVGAGLVTSLARPGANVTGTSVISPDLDLKRFQVLHDFLPAAKRVGELAVPANPVDRIRTRSGGLLAPLGMQLILVEVAQASDLEDAVAEAVRRGAQALHISNEPLLSENFPQILHAAEKHSLPTLGDGRGFLEAGGLVSYGPDSDELDRQLEYFIDRILRGTKPSDLPIQQPRKFELGINLKAAKAIGITIPRSLLLLADKVVD